MQLPSVRFTIRKGMVLVALLAAACWIFAVLGARVARAERENCRTALQQITWALLAYPAREGTFPPGTVPGGALLPEQRLSWVTLIVYWTDYFQSIRYLFDQQRPWDAPENRLPRIRISNFDAADQIVDSTEAPQLPRPLTCPANHSLMGPGMPGPMHYIGIAGLGTDAPSLPSGHARAGVFGYDRRTRLDDISDGASATMILAETTATNGPWTAGGPATMRGLDSGRQPYVGRGRQFGGAHPGGAMAAFADGSVRFLGDSIAPNVFEALSTVAGGEVLPERWDQ